MTAEWVVTATTIYCDAVEDEVTIMINRDGTAQCTGFRKYAEPAGETARLVKIRGERLGRPLRCEGLDCDRIVRYRDKLREEDGEQAGGGR